VRRTQPDRCNCRRESDYQIELWDSHEDLPATAVREERTNLAALVVLEASREGRRNHVGASADLKAVAAEIKEQVRVLVRFRFRENGELMGRGPAPGMSLVPSN